MTSKPRSSTESKGEGLGTVARATRILSCIAESREDVSIKFLADELGLAPSTVHRLIHLLIDQGFVARSPGGHTYRVGHEMLRLGSLVVDRWNLPAIAKSYMQRVVAACDEFCMLNLYVPVERCMMIVETVASSHPLNYGAEKFVQMPLAWGATGRAITAYLPEDEIRAIYDISRDSPADGSELPPLDVFVEELRAIRSRGYAHTVGQKMPGAVGIAAPVFGADGNVEASISLTIPEIRFQVARAQSLYNIIVEQASALSYALGYRPQMKQAKAAQ